MNNKELQDLRDALIAGIGDLAKPIDFPDLESRGVLSKVGAWYRIHKIDALPRNATQKITEIAQDSKGIKAKFSSASKYERLAQKVARLGGK